MTMRPHAQSPAARRFARSFRRLALGGGTALLALSFAAVSLAAEAADPPKDPPKEGAAEAKPADPPAAAPAPEPAEAKPAPKPAEAPKEAKPAEPAPGKAAAGDTKVKDAQAGNLVEELPSSAYPSSPIRGLEGGSLWSTFHGQSWPYYPKTGIGVSGYAWIDTGYENITRGNPTESNIKYVVQQGRMVLRVTPTWTDGDWFVQAQSELVGNKEQSAGQPFNADVDDLWVRAGQLKKWDITAGRFEGFEIYHLGMGLDLNTLERLGATGESANPPDYYGATYAYYRPASVGDLAFHLFPTEWLRFEALGQFGNENGLNTEAGRGAAVIDFGWLKVKGGGEYKAQGAQKNNGKEERTLRGFAGSVQLVGDPWIEGGANYGYGLIDHTDVNGNIDETGSSTTWSGGGFINVRPYFKGLLAGAGVNYTKQQDIHYERATDRYGNFDHLQAFGALQYNLFERLYVKGVVAYAKASFDPSFRGAVPAWSNEMVSARVRFQVLF